MMAFRSLASCVVASALISACATAPVVKVDSDPKANFASYHNYAMTATRAPGGINPFVFQLVQETIERQLASRGYVKAEPADFAVGFTIGARDKVNVDNFGPYAGGFGPYGYGGWRGYNSMSVYETREGSLSIDMFDAATKKPVWFGSTSGTISRGGATDAEINEAVAAIIAKFPPAGAVTATDQRP